MALPEITVQGEPNLKAEDFGSVLDFQMGQETNIDKAFQDYLGKTQAQIKPLEVFEQLEQKAGLPEMKKVAGTLRGQVYGLEDSLRRVEPDVAARSRNSLVTEAQRRGMVTAGQKPLMENLGTLSTSLGRVESGIQSAGSDIAQRTGLVLQGQQQELDPYKMNIQLMGDRAARLTTGFTADREMRYNLLMDKLQRNRQLSDIERREAFELQVEKNKFDQQKEMFNIEASKPSARATQTVSLGNNRTALIDSQTGQVINTYGSSGTGTKSGAAAYLPAKTNSYSKYMS